MAKKTSTVEADSSAETYDPALDPNAPKQGDKPVLWSPEDLARLDQAVTEVSSVLLELRNRLESLENRFLATESKLARFDFGEGILPAEVASGVDPADIYRCALQAAILSVSIGNPTGLLHDSSRAANMKRCFDTAEAALNEGVRRSALREKK